ncbi:uncharacterized protein [Cherax quadricarinatus]|uniref:uncharacterized protein n=1 Tax=Cherax quadricarinatus TaxID=27406 RepID=UPI0023780DD2|nr:uncharacterized protein LOC128689399 [Cherax quadricarinatus]
MDNTECDSESEVNFVRYLLAVQQGSRRCLEDIFRLLYRAWSHGKTYDTLQEFCVDALGWEREDLANLFILAENDLGSTLGGRNFPNKSQRVHGVQQPLRSPSENVKPQVLCDTQHTIRPSRSIVRKKRSSWKIITRSDTSVILGPGLQGLHDVKQAPQESGDSTEEVSCETCRPNTGVGSHLPRHSHSVIPVSVDRITPSRQEAGSIVPPKQEAGNIVPLKQKANYVVPSKQDLRTVVPSKQDLGTVVLSKQDIGTVVLLKQDLDTVVPSKQDPDTVVPSKQDRGTVVLLKQDLDTVVPSKQDLDTVLLSKQDLDTVVPSKQVLDTVVLSKQDLDTVVPSKQDLDTVVPSKQVLDTVVLSKQDLDTVVPSKQDLDTVVPSKQVLDTVVLSKQDLDSVVPSKQDLDTVVRSKQDFDTVVPSQEASHVVLSKQEADNVVLKTQDLGTVVPSKHKAGIVVTSKQDPGNVVPSKQKVGNVVPSKQKAGSVVPSKQKVGNVVSSKQKVVNVVPLKQKPGNVVPSKQKVDNVVPSKQKVGNVVPSKKAGNVVPSKQKVGNVVPSKKVGNIVPSKQKFGIVVPSKKAGKVVPLKQKASHIVPSKDPGNIVPSKQDPGNVLPSKQEVVNIVPSRQEAGNVVPSKQEVGNIVPSRQEAGNVVPSKQEVGNIVPSRQEAGNVVPSKQEAGNVVPSKQEADVIVPSKQEVDIIVPSKQEADIIVPSKQEADNVVPSKQEAGNVVPSKQEAGNVVPSKQEAGNVVPSKQEAGNVVPSKQEAGNVVPSKQEADNVVPSKQEADNVVPSKQEADNVVPSKQEADNVVPSKQEAGNVVPSKQEAGNVVPSKQEADNVVPSKQEAGNVVPSKQEAGNVVPSKQEVTKVVLSKQEAGNVVPSKQETDNVVPSKQEADNVVPSKQEVAKVVLSKQEAGNVVLSKQEAGNVVPSKQEAGNVVLSKQEAGNVVPSEQEAGKVVPSKQEAGNVVPSKQEAGNVVPSKDKTSVIVNQEPKFVESLKEVNLTCSPNMVASVASPEQEANSITKPKKKNTLIVLTRREDSRISPAKLQDSCIVPSKQEDSRNVPAKQEDTCIVPTKQEDTCIVPTKQEDTCIVPTKQQDSRIVPNIEEADSVGQSTQVTVDSVAQSTQVSNDSVVISTEELSRIIHEASHTLRLSQGHQISNLNTLNTNQTNLLDLQPDPSQLPQKVLVLLLTVGFPQLPARAKYMLQRLQHLVYVVCYQDIEFDDHHLAMRLRGLSNVISELLSIVVHYCKQVIERDIKEVADKLRIAKQRFRKAKKVFEEHVNLVMKTREDLKSAERDLQEAKIKNSKLFKVYSRSQSQEPEETTRVANADICGRARRLHSVGAISNYTYTDASGQRDSGNVSLADELDGRGLETRRQDGARDVGDSLFVSVMKEVVAIEKKHGSFREVDRKLKKMLRNSQESVIMTKKKVSDRLNSNVSAEQDAIAKEDIVNERFAVTNKLAKEIRKFRQDYKALQEEESVMISDITDDVETKRMMELSEEALFEGRRGVQTLRRDERGKLVTTTRQHTAASSSSAGVFDVGEWLMRKRFVATEVKKVYSNLKVNDTEDIVDVLEILGTSIENPSVVILSGPKGSGKSSICHYLLHQWRFDKFKKNSRLHEFDLVVYCKLSDMLPSMSWNQYLRDHIFCLTLKDFPDTDIYEALGTITALFLLDLGTLTSSYSEVLKDVFSNLGKNQAVVTVRPGSENGVAEIAKGLKLEFLRASLCPMTPEAIKYYSSVLLSMVEKSSSVVAKVNQFTKLLQTMNVTETLLYPLPVAYLLHVWRLDPCFALRSTSVSHLFSQVIILCQQTLMEALNVELRGDRVSTRVRVEQLTHHLYEAAWTLLTRQSWAQHDHTLLEPQHKLMENPLFLNSFSPLLVVREETDRTQRGVLPHASLAEILCGFFLTNQRLRRSKGSPLLRRREKLEKYCVPEIKRFRYVLPHAAGALVYNKHSLNDAKEIASLYLRSLSEDRDMISWLVLLRECDFITHMCTAASGVLSIYNTWTVAHHDQQTNCAVSDLLRKGAYQPQLIIISQTFQGGKCRCGGSCIIRALSTCSSTLVHLRQESQFYAWGEEETCDSLVVPLQPPGTLQECWGHLGVEGAMALRHSHHLEELNVRISSCEALAALVHSLVHLQRRLRFLYIRLDISPSTPASSLQPLNFTGRRLWLRMRGISDSSVDWIKDVTSRLNNWYTEVLLEESRVSPSLLQDLKESLPHTDVHISS